MCSSQAHLATCALPSLPACSTLHLLSLAQSWKTWQLRSSLCGSFVQESERVMSTVLSVQPRSSHSAGGVSNDEVVATAAQDILANLPALLARQDASIARDPFAPLPTGGHPHTHAPACTGPCRDAQDRLLWGDNTRPACQAQALSVISTIMSLHHSNNNS